MFHQILSMGSSWKGDGNSDKVIETEMGASRRLLSWRLASDMCCSCSILPHPPIQAERMPPPVRQFLSLCPVI